MKQHTITAALVAAAVALAPWLAAGAQTADGAAAAAPRQSYSVAGARDGAAAVRANGTHTTAADIAKAASPQVPAQRRSRYTEVSGSSPVRAAATGAEVRAPASARAGQGDYWIYSADVQLLRDDDADGFHHRFALDFDADTGYHSADVYARLYLSYEGGPYYLYHVTDVFTIDGAASDDHYHVETTLTSGYPSGYYDLAIDLYEAGSDYVVASFDAYDDPRLATLPLEDLGYEYGSGAVRAVFAGVVLLADLDYDGFHQSFAIDLDVDAPHAVRALYAVIDARRAGGAWLHEHTTSTFTVDGTGSHDLLRVHADWDSGYPTGFYDFRIRIFDAGSGLLQAQIGPGTPTLAAVPLEDAVSDDYIEASDPSYGHAVSYEHGGSAGFDAWAIAALAVLLWQRRRLLRPACTRERGRG